jgi:hypothetical protein
MVTINCAIATFNCHQIRCQENIYYGWSTIFIHLIFQARCFAWTTNSLITYYIYGEKFSYFCSHWIEESPKFSWQLSPLILGFSLDDNMLFSLTHYDLIIRVLGVLSTVYGSKGCLVSVSSLTLF